MTVHVPVLPTECLGLLHALPGSVIVDGTLGGGGHTRLLAERVGPNGRVIGLDRDAAAIERVRQAGVPPQVTLLQANFGKLDAVLDYLEIGAVDGVLLDLGLSSDQLEDPARGFSFHSGGDLDLRFDVSSGEAAWQLAMRLPEQELAEIIYRYGEERFSRRIARRIVERRETEPIRSVARFADLVRSCVPRSRGHAIDPATRTFQALRIAVNHELEWLEKGLAAVPGRLRPGGRVAVISFHSLEDRIVKHFFRDDPRLSVVTKKPVLASEAELQANSRSRSAKLRAAEKTPVPNAVRPGLTTARTEPG